MHYPGWRWSRKRPNRTPSAWIVEIASDANPHQTRAAVDYLRSCRQPALWRARREPGALRGLLAPASVLPPNPRTATRQRASGGGADLALQSIPQGDMARGTARRGRRPKRPGCPGHVRFSGPAQPGAIRAGESSLGAQPTGREPGAIMGRNTRLFQETSGGRRIVGKLAQPPCTRLDAEQEVGV